MAVVFFIALVIFTVVWVQGGMLYPLALPHLPHLPLWLSGAIGLVCLSWLMKD